MITASGPGGSYSYSYNGQGDRLQQTVGGVTTRYALDLNNSISLVLSDGSSTYLYGLDRIAQQNVIGRQYYLGDALGSVRQLTNAAGAVTQARSYEPFGKQLTAAGNPLSKYAFTGEWQDPTGLIFLRARYYDPATGRFLSKDLVRGFSQLPSTFNPYVYGFNSPLRYTDPDGQFPIPILVIIGIAGAFIFFSQIPSDQYQIDPMNWGNPGIQAIGIALMSTSCFSLFNTNLSQLWDVLKLRWAYEGAVRALRSEALQKLANGESNEAVARWAHGARRLLGVTYKGMTPPELLEIIYARNLQKYGDSLGPSIDYLIGQGKSWVDIIESASRPGGMDVYIKVILYYLFGQR